jgi:tetratricopeptide (TPR) repeat protein
MNAHFATRPLALGLRRRAGRLAIVGAAIAAATLLSLGGCRSHEIIADDPQSRLLKAHEIAQDAQDLARKGKASEAIALYTKAAQTSRAYAPAWYNLGVLLMEQDRSMEAAEAFTVAAENDLTDPRPHTALGLLAQKLVHYDEAARYYTQALERSDRYLPALRKSIEVDQLRDKYDDMTLQRVRRALYIETDPAWKDFLMRQKLKAEQRVSKGAL